MILYTKSLSTCEGAKAYSLPDVSRCYPISKWRQWIPSKVVKRLVLPHYTYGEAVLM